MAKRCDHRRDGFGLFAQFNSDGKPRDQHAINAKTPVAWRCARCKDYVSLGDANIGVPHTAQVAIERRAAELSNLAASHATAMEASGWSAHMHDSPMPIDDPQWQAGWFGHAIFMHDKEPVTTRRSAAAGRSDTARESSNSTASSSSTAISSAVAVHMNKSHDKRTPLLPRANAAREVQISERQRGVLGHLAAYGDWARPMDVGARDGSHHSATLSQLARHGLADRRKRHAIYCYNGSTQRQKLVDNSWVYTDGHPPSTKCCCKGSCLYKITLAGRKVVGR